MKLLHHGNVCCTIESLERLEVYSELETFFANKRQGRMVRKAGSCEKVLRRAALPNFHHGLHSTLHKLQARCRVAAQSSVLHSRRCIGRPRNLSQPWRATKIVRLRFLISKKLPRIDRFQTPCNYTIKMLYKKVNPDVR